MADEKLTALPAASTLDLTDLAYAVTDPSGTPTSKKATWQVVKDTVAQDFIPPRVQTVVSAPTVTPDADTDDVVLVSDQNENLTIANPTGTAVPGQVLIIGIIDSAGGPFTITWDTLYFDNSLAGFAAPHLPLSTLNGNSFPLYATFEFNPTVQVGGAWVLVALEPAVGAPSGSTDDVQFNNNGTFDGNSNFTTDGNGNVILAGTLTAAGISAPITSPGSDTQVLFNDGGTIAGNANFLFDKNLDQVKANAIAGLDGAQLILTGGANTGGNGNTVNIEATNAAASSSQDGGSVILQPGKGDTGGGGNDGYIYFRKPGSVSGPARVSASNLTALRTILFPDQSGTFALAENATLATSFVGLLNATLTDQAFFVADRAYQVTAITEVHSAAAAVTANVQVTKDTSTTAPGGGTDLLTNNTNAGFDLHATANTVQTGSLSGTPSDLQLAAGDRLSVDFSGTLTSAAGVVISIALMPI